MCLGLGLYLGRELRPFLMGVGKQGVDVLFTGIEAVLCGRRALGHEFRNTYCQPANIHSVKAANDNEASCSLHGHRVGKVQRTLAI
jgi:hypothetical protein